MVVVPLRRARGVLRQEQSPDEMDLEEVRATPNTPAVCARKQQTSETHSHLAKMKEMK